MHNRNDYMVLEVPSLRENVALVRVTVAAFAARLPFTIAELEELKVAVSEAVTNAIVHAYPATTGCIRIEAVIIDGGVKVSVIDDGRGLVAAKSKITDEGEEQRTGMGFSFMESFTDDLSVTSPAQGGTAVHMIKRPARQREEHE